MELNIDKFNKWCRESGLCIELNTQQWSAEAILEGSLGIRGYMEDIIKCLVILMDNWDKKEKKKKNKKIKHSR